MEAFAYDIDGIPMRFRTEGWPSMSSIVETAKRLSLDVVYLRDLSMSPRLSERKLRV